MSFLSSELRGVRLERSMGPGVNAEQERNKQRRRKSREGGGRLRLLRRGEQRL